MEVRGERHSKAAVKHLSSNASTAIVVASQRVVIPFGDVVYRSRLDPREKERFSYCVGAYRRWDEPRRRSFRLQQAKHRLNCLLRIQKQGGRCRQVVDFQFILAQLGNTSWLDKNERSLVPEMHGVTGFWSRTGRGASSRM